MKILQTVHNPEGLDRNPQTGEFTNLNEEYIILENNKSLEEDISFWKIKDGGNSQYVFPLNTMVPSGQKLYLYSGEGTDSGLKFYWNRKRPVWNNISDKASLYDKNDNLIDSSKVEDTITVTGIVQDANTLQPIAGATVFVEDIYVKTGSDGRYSIIVPRTTVKITAAMTGYDDKDGVIPRVGAKVVNFLLEQNPSNSAISVALVSNNFPQNVDIKDSYQLNFKFQNTGMTVNSFVVELYERKSGVATWTLIDEYICEDSAQKDSYWEVVFSLTGKDWDWYDFDFGFAESGQMSQRYEYKIIYRASKPFDNLESESEVEDMEINFVIPDFKTQAMDDYNDSQWIIVIATVLAVGLLLAGGIVLAVPSGGLSVGIALLVVGSLSSLVAFLSNSLQGTDEQAMNDPFNLVSNFKKICRSAVNTVSTTSVNPMRVVPVDLFNNVSKVYTYAKDFDVTKDRLFTAYKYGKKTFIDKQKAKLLSLVDKIEEECSRFADLKNQFLGMFNFDLTISPAKFNEMKSYLVNHDIPDDFKTKLKRYGMTEEQIQNIRQSVTHVQINGRSLDIKALLAQTDSNVSHILDYVELIKDKIL